MLLTTRLGLRSASYDPTSRSRHWEHRVRLRRISLAAETAANRNPMKLRFKGKIYIKTSVNSVTRMRPE